MFFIKLNRVQVQFSSYLYSWKINLKIKQFTAAGQLLFCIFNVQFINILMSIMVIIFTLQFCTNDIALKIVIINSLRPVDLYSHWGPRWCRHSLQTSPGWGATWASPSWPPREVQTFDWNSASKTFLHIYWSSGENIQVYFRNQEC